MQMRRTLAFWLIGLALAATLAAEPVNLSRAKADVRAYYAAPEGYERDLKVVTDEAIQWLETRVVQKAVGERLAIVFDVDETVLSNLPQMDREDFGYNAPDWIAWVTEGVAPAIEPVREVYRTARRLGVAVVFLTGRTDPEQKTGTLDNLKRADMAAYERIIFREVGEPGDTAAARKTARRAALEAEGWVIVANVGDQQSDLVGGHAERTFKIPNPCYELP